MAQVLAVDFGTSNSAAGVLVQDRPYLIEVEAGEKTLPTAMFFEQGRATVFGRAAQVALTEGREGRYMRALKSVLGTPLMHEERRIMGETLTLIDVVARFLRQIKERAEADLRLAYARAGFEQVSFMYEPEAAALATGTQEGLALIVDIGGGTSDFSVVRGAQVLASHGIRLGGTDFDQALSVEHVMPLLGRGSQLRDAFGPGMNEAPQAIFHDLASWQKIAFLYSPETLRFAKGMQKVAVEPDKLDRLVMVLETEMGHDLAFAVERGKIAATSREDARIDLRLIEPGLAVELGKARVAACLAAQMTRIGAAAQETLEMAGIAPDSVERVIFVGGASLMPSVAEQLARLCPQAQQVKGEAFTAIIDGLCVAASQKSAL